MRAGNGESVKTKMVAKKLRVLYQYEGIIMYLVNPIY